MLLAAAWPELACLSTVVSLQWLLCWCVEFVNAASTATAREKERVAGHVVVFFLISVAAAALFLLVQMYVYILMHLCTC